MVDFEYRDLYVIEMMYGVYSFFFLNYFSRLFHYGFFSTVVHYPTAMVIIVNVFLRRFRWRFVARSENATSG